ncbi:hypothetical protein BS297_13525 [Rhodococcus erythropolis]|uniref:Transposase n=1 Tax=Rhodococcus erythropolis TaxID=1833 RepID=A0A5N5E3T2_RHOER|nr:hypothetical protein BS297_13525 [Rhodococcus erythropolis]
MPRCEDQASLKGFGPCHDRYPPEFRFRAVALVRAGKLITTAAIEFAISAAALHKWVRQDQVERGERAGLTTTE